MWAETLKQLENSCLDMNNASRSSQLDYCKTRKRIDIWRTAVTERTLFLAPGACSRVTLHALESCGASYETRLVNLWEGENNSAEYLAKNPKGKIPALAVGEKVLAENAAILYHLHSHFPEAKLLPSVDNRLGENTPLEDLIWCSSTLHPMTRMTLMPMRFTEDQDNHAGIKAHGITLWQAVLSMLDERFKDGAWWYGSEWSIIDTYIYWACRVAALGGLELQYHPAVLAHADAVQQLDTYKSAVRREVNAMEDRGIPVPENWQ